LLTSPGGLGRLQVRFSTPVAFIPCSKVVPIIYPVPLITLPINPICTLLHQFNNILYNHFIIFNNKFDRVTTLKEHREKLLEKRMQLDLLIANVAKTIALTDGRVKMSDNEKFEESEASCNNCNNSLVVIKKPILKC